MVLVVGVISKPVGKKVDAGPAFPSFVSDIIASEAAASV
jgi:hypothetical protein